MRVCIDITELYNVDFISGIQRVVIEITTRWIKSEKKVLLLVYSPKTRNYLEVDNLKYVYYYEKKAKEKDYIKKDTCIEIKDFGSNDVFFDMDSVWMNANKRSFLLPKLKERGCKIAAHIYDIIPITHPQYCHEFTTLSFMEYIGAQLKYSNLIIANAKATINDIEELIVGTEVSEVNGNVVKLGSDIKKSNSDTKIRNELLELKNQGKYVLMVGTMEPRKNHEFVLNAFEEQLFDMGIHLVFAGRIGWNIERLLERINQNKWINKKLFLYNDLTDREISYLYENSLLVAFPSYNEGFGLPIIEAFERGTPVLAADIPVLREVGESFCDYFDLDCTKDFIELVKKYASDDKYYGQKKLKVKNYVKYTWDESAEKMYEVLSQLC